MRRKAGIVEIKWLEDFVALAEVSSFSRAAEVRNVTQPAFSRRIKQLEAWVGAPLINRATMPAELTPAGRNFLPMAQDTIRMFSSVRETLRPPAEQGLVRFAALHTLTVTFFPGWLRELQERSRHFGTSFIADRGGIEANLQALTDGETDFFLTYTHREVPFHLDREKFASLAIGTDRLIPVAAPELRIDKAATAMAGLLDRPGSSKLAVPYLGYGYSSFFGVALGRMFARNAPFRRKTVHESTISAGLKELALTGAGLCWLPQSLVGRELAQGLLVVCADDPAWSLDLEIRLYRSAARSGPMVEALWRAAGELALRNS
jgi:DNA-binding transcriptional LysR family regulator